jgi:hypothetical protein
MKDNIQKDMDGNNHVKLNRGRKNNLSNKETMLDMTN